MFKILIAGEGKTMKHYINAIAESGMVPVTGIDISNCEGFDALLLPGSVGDIDPKLYGAENTASYNVDRALDDAQLKITELFVKAGKPVFGICKGCQLLNVYFGGTLIQDVDTDKTHKYIGKDNAHEVINEPGFLIYKLHGGSCTVNSLHHQAVGKVADCLRVTSRCPSDGIVEALEHESLPIWAVQWHPERMAYEKRRDDCCNGASFFLALKRILESARL